MVGNKNLAQQKFTEPAVILFLWKTAILKFCRDTVARKINSRWERKFSLFSFSSICWQLSHPTCFLPRMVFDFVSINKTLKPFSSVSKTSTFSNVFSERTRYATWTEQNQNFNATRNHKNLSVCCVLLQIQEPRIPTRELPSPCCLERFSHRHINGSYSGKPASEPVLYSGGESPLLGVLSDLRSV